MIKIDIDNSTCRIQGLNTKQFNELRSILSYKTDPAATYFSQDPSQGVRYLLGKRGEFPTGLLYLVKSYLREKRLEVSSADQRIRPTATLAALTCVKLTHDPYVEQKEAATACGHSERGIVTAPTGSGKSVMIALTIAKLQVRTLVVVPSLELKKQLIASLTAAFGPGSVGGLGKQVAVENVAALDPSQDMKALYGYDCVIIDEFHHAGAASYRALNKKSWKGIYYRFGFTATPFRSQDNERLLLESVLSKVVYRLSYEAAVKKGYIVPVEAYYYELPVRQVKGTTYPQVYKELVVDHKGRNDLIVSLLKQLAEQGLSTLCLVKEIQHGANLVSGTKVNFIKGENEDNREKILEFNLNENRLLVATTGVCGEGVDTKPCEYVVIAGLGKSKNAFMQQVGRGFRRYPGKESCKVIIFMDKSHKWTYAHYQAQVKYLRDEYGIKPARLEVG